MRWRRGSPEVKRVRVSITALWANKQLRYLFFGSLNTAFAYGVYALILWLVSLSHSRWDYVLATGISWLISNVTSFLLQRQLVFIGKGKVWHEFVRFTSVTGVSFIVNLGMGAFAVEVLGLDSHIQKLVSQFVITLILVVATYFLHQNFSFRQGGRGTEKSAVVADVSE